LIPLALAPGASRVKVRGGTHVPWSPPFHYLAGVYLPMLARLDLQAVADLLAWGWYPAGGGEIVVEIGGQTAAPVATESKQWTERGPLKRISGIAVASDLPAHIA
jgi:RNA 3'-terminal phosphate cyclase (ATP)